MRCPRLVSTILISGPLAVAACADGSEPSPAGASVAIVIGAIDLPELAFACFDVRVEGDSGELVWQAGDTALSHAAGDLTTICSDAFGDGAGGGVTYVGACDAEERDGMDGGHAMNDVTLWVDGLYDAAGMPIAGWRDPCPSGCTIATSCGANADAAVVFDLTVMRPADQGFFDIGATLEDVFCSAKVDCVDALLHDPAAGARGPTAVLALACTAGPDGDQTTLYLDEVVITCAGGEVYTIDPIGAGQLGGLEPGLFQTAVYTFAEALAGVDKCAWNVALGLDVETLADAPTLGADCHLTTRASAAQVPFGVDGADFVSPAWSAYPVIDVDVALTDASGALVCGAHPLDGPGGGVYTRYTSVTTPEGERFAYGMACGEAPAGPPPMCMADARLEAAATAPGDLYGIAAAIAGDLAVVGAQRGFGAVALSGSAHVFRRDASGAWLEIAALAGPGDGALAQLGRAVAMTDQDAAIAAPNRDVGGFEGAGAVHVFALAPDGTPLGSVLLSASDKSNNAFFGSDVAIDGARIGVGARNAGRAYVFDRVAGAWQQTTLIVGPASAGDFGQSVAIGPTRMIVGAPSSGGGAHIYEEVAGVWVLAASLASPETSVSFGFDVALDGDRVIVGAPGNIGGTLPFGAGYVYEREPGGSWTQAAVLAPSDPSNAYHYGGWSVALDGDRAVLGAVSNGSSGSGALFVFARDAGGSWTQTHVLPSPSATPNDGLGYGLAIDGARIVGGAPRSSSLGVDAGSAWVFDLACD